MQENTSLVVWNPEWDLGVPSIDIQHQHFVNLLNTLYSFFQTGKSKEEVLPTIEDLQNYAKLHFGTEEQYIMASKYPGFEYHKSIHNDLKATLSDLTEKYIKGDSQDLMNLLDFLENWLIDHLVKEDSLYKEHFLRANIQ